MGLHIIGMGADEMLQGFGVALQVRCNTIILMVLASFYCT